MKFDALTLAIRALNHWRSYYQPSYIGLRLLLQQFPRSSLPYIMRRYLLEKLPSRQLGKYRRFSRFKRLGHSHQVECRDMYAASPSSALGESYALSLLSEIPSMGNRPCVYSYQWPTVERTGGSYRYFYSGYRERNQLITEMVQKNSSYHVVVRDIRDFYPSVSIDTVLQRLASHLAYIKDDSIKNYIETISYQLLSTSNAGIPIGPALGHVFGNIALEKVDQQMHNIFANRYMRYVDDIVLVVEPSETKKAITELNHLIESEGLELNEDKEDEISANDWLGNQRTELERKSSQQFDAFIKRIRLFLWWRPRNKDSLHELFKEQGIPIPVQRIALSAMYGRFHHYMRHIFWNNRSLFNLARATLPFETERKLITEVSRLRQVFSSSIQMVPSPQATEHLLLRKMRIQRLKYLFAKLLYFFPIGDYRHLLSMIPEIDEFHEYHSLINALTSRTLGPLLYLPGPVITTFASFCRELGISSFNYNEKELDSKSTFDSVCELVTSDLVTPPKSWAKSLSNDDMELLKFCLFESTETRTHMNYQYVDEVRSLQLNLSKDDRDYIISTRYSDVEGINLEALLVPAYGS